MHPGGGRAHTTHRILLHEPQNFVIQLFFFYFKKNTHSRHPPPPRGGIHHPNHPKSAEKSFIEPLRMTFWYHLWPDGLPLSQQPQPTHPPTANMWVWGTPASNASMAHTHQHNEFHSYRINKFLPTTGKPSYSLCICLPVRLESLSSFCTH